VLNGTKEVEDMQIFVDFLVHERELLEKKSSNSGQTKTQKENETIKEKIVETLKELGRYATITEIQEGNEELGAYSNQKISALLKQLVDTQVVEKMIDKKKAYFKA
jgi:DNA-binding transcriptional regulator GbsR (MarR family)